MEKREEEEDAASMDELRLLSRLDLSRRSSEQTTTPVHHQAQPSSSASGTQQRSSSSFSALLAASRRLASSSNSSSSPSLPVDPAPPTDRLRRAHTLPTLREEAQEMDDRVHPEISVDGDTQELHAVEDLEKEEVLNQPEPVQTIDQPREEEEEEQDPAFASMLLQLTEDPSTLALSISDLTVRKLRRVSRALAAFKDSDQESTWRHKMQIVRLVLAIDTLGLLLERFEEENVLLAVTNSVRRLFERHAIEGGMERLLHAPAVLTSRNVAAVVLAVRQSLVQDNNNNRLSPSPPKNKTPTKQVKRRPTAAVHLTTKSPVSTSRRSILMQEGLQVLMHEKIASFQHRRLADHKPQFKVRHADASATEKAAARRKRSISYGNEQSRSQPISSRYEDVN